MLPIEKHAKAALEQLEMGFKSWAEKFKPIANPQYPQKLVFDEDQADFLKSQDNETIWEIWCPWGQDPLTFERASPSGCLGFRDDGTFCGYLVTEVPWNEDLVKGGFEVQVAADVNCLELECPEDESCWYCGGESQIKVSVVQ
jgi:hypothetical protein